MALPAMLITALQVVGTAMAAKTLIQGLKEGNLLKAVLGGVGAYFGMNSLTSSGTAAAAGTSTATAEGLSAAGGTQMEQLAAQTGSWGAEGTAAALADIGATEGLSVTGGLLSKATGGFFDNPNVMPLGATEVAPVYSNLDAPSDFLLNGSGGGGGGLLGQSAGGAVSPVVQSNIVGIPGSIPAAAPTSFAQKLTEEATGILGKGWQAIKDAASGVTKENAPFWGGVAQGAGNWMMNQDVMDYRERLLNEERARRGAVPTGVTSWRFDPVTRQMVKVTG